MGDGLKVLLLLIVTAACWPLAAIFVIFCMLKAK